MGRCYHGTEFHGTEWGAAIQIVQQNAFINGPGTHNVCGKTLAGCWCVPTLPDALLRCNPARFLDPAQGPSRWCCPVVLQLRAARYVRMPRSTMHCAPGEIGSVHNGLVIDQIHLNTRLMQNFMALETQVVRRSLLDDPTRNRICKCGLCSACTHANDASWHEWRKSKKGWYHRRCHTRVTTHLAVWFSRVCSCCSDKSRWASEPNAMYSSCNDLEREIASGTRAQCPLQPMHSPMRVL